MTAVDKKNREAVRMFEQGFTARKEQESGR